MPRVEVVRTYLEMRDPSQLVAAEFPPGDVRVVARNPCAVEDYRRLYSAVGGPWHWRDRLVWTDEQLRAHLASPDISVWELVVGRESAGYFELRRSAPEEVEIAYFGLDAPFIGRGLGGAMLTRAVEEAWALGARRVWLHTCTLDSPRALPNYRARGFREYDTERYLADL